VINRPALQQLKVFVASPSPASLNYLACIPCLYWLLKMEQQPHLPFWDSSTLALCSQLIKKSEDVSKNMIRYESPALDLLAEHADGGWKKVITKIFE
jgi:hypothetical protein